MEGGREGGRKSRGKKVRLGRIEVNSFTHFADELCTEKYKVNLQISLAR